MAINKVLLLGRLGKDPEIRFTASQTAVGNFSLATGDRRKDASGNWVEHTEWHNIVVFGNSAQNCAKFLKKGREVFIEGRIQTRKWTDKEGKDRYTTEIVANTVQFIGGGKGAEGAGASDAAGASSSAGSLGGMTGGGMPPGLQSADQISATMSAPAEVAFDDDDIPF